MITRKQHLAEYTGKTRKEQHELHLAYYAQFVTPTIVTRLRTFLQWGGDMNNLQQVEILSQKCPREVNELMLQAGDFPTLNGMLCIYKTLYELQQREKYHETTV